MIAHSRLAQVGSLLLSATVLVGGMYAAAPDMRIEIAGAGETVEARMGTSFQDMAIGTLMAETTDQETQPVHPTTTDAPPPPDAALPTNDATQTPRQEVAATPAAAPTKTPMREIASVIAPKPSVQQATVPPAAYTAPTAMAVQTPTPPPDSSLAPMISAELSPIPALPLLAIPPAETVEKAPLTPTVTATPPLAKTASVTPAPKMSPIEPPQTIASENASDIVPTRSSRPKARDPKLAAKAIAERPKPVVKQAARKPAPRGNAQRNNTQGAASGTNRQAAAKSQGNTGKRSSQAGNAAVSNYPGEVMRKISRVPKPRVRTRGTTVVAFKIAAGGGLASVSVARSSGSSALDKAALGVVRKASPFPKPPLGAQTGFSIRIEGR